MHERATYGTYVTWTGEDFRCQGLRQAIGVGGRGCGGVPVSRFRVHWLEQAAAVVEIAGP